MYKKEHATTAIYDGEPDTMKEWCLKYLVKNGMFANQAEEVFVRFKIGEVAKVMRELWDTPHTSYPTEVKAALTIGLNAEAVKYIDQELPQAWYRPIFAGEA